MVHSQYSSVQTELHWVPSEAIASLAPSMSTLVWYRSRAVAVAVGSLPVAALKVMTHIKTSALALTVTLDIHLVGGGQLCVIQHLVLTPGYVA